MHVAAVQVVHQQNNEADLVPLRDEDITKAVQNCLNMVVEIDDEKGVISPEGTNQRKQEVQDTDNYQPIKSIMFPLFGTGRGGRTDVKLVAQEMLEAMSNYLHVPQNCAKLSLESIHLCGYSHGDVEAIREAMEAVFPSQTPWR